MKKIIMLMLVISMSISMVACVGKDLTQENDNATTTSGDKKAGENKKTPIEDLKIADSLKLNIALGNNSRTITYQQATPLTLPDGTVVTQGDLKPTWQFIEDELGIELIDVAVQDQKASEMIDIAAAEGFKNATVFGGNSIAEELMSYGAQGYFINLKEYLDYMPNFSKYLEENPNVAKAITAHDGGIYHVPYVAEIDNYARVLHGRKTWITTLLDSKDQLVDETATLEVKYEGYWETRHDKNVIKLQNEAAQGGKLTRDVALDTLLSYIAETYPELEKPSDLYLGKTAKYDIDELVALWRVIELSPNTLTKVTTGEVVSGAEISPYFVRRSKYREDIFRLVTYFGGQRVFGSDSYYSRFYLDENGELHFSYYEDDFLAAVEHLKNIYAEGLVHSEFSDLSNTDIFRKDMYSKDNEEGHKLFGFMTDDWIASTTASNNDVVSMLPPVTTIKGSGSDEFIHFVENTRVIKPDGWSISAASKEEEINAALKLFDFLFSEEGHKVYNYGVPSTLVEGEVFESGGIEYPKFSDWTFEAALEFKSGDISSFLRDFMGSHIPIGYQKEIGFEKQYTYANGIEGWELYETVGVKSTSYSSENPLFRLVPPVFSLTEQDTAKLSNLAIGDDQTDLLFLYITGSNSAPSSIEEIKKIYEESGIEEYIEVYKRAYERMTN